MSLRVLAAAADPALPARIRALLEAVWPPFILHAAPLHPLDDADGWLALAERLPHHQLALLDARGALVAACNSVPLACPPDTPLPDEGWDWALQQSTRPTPAPADTLCALAVTVAPDHQGQGLSRVCLGALRRLAHDQGLSRLIVPVRPSWKTRYPLTDIDDYLRWTTPEGLPLDPWLRTHVRLGGQVLGACRRSMQMQGGVADWERWLSMPLPQSGAFVAPGLLRPLQVDRTADQATYAEPNVWVQHTPQGPGREPA